MTEEETGQKFEKAMEGIREHHQRTRHLSSINTNFPAYRELVALGKDVLPYLQDMMKGSNEPRHHILEATCDILKNSGIDVSFPEQIQGRLSMQRNYLERIITELRFPKHGGVTPEFLANQPIPLEAYQCPKCNATLAMPYEDALKHVAVPVRDKLPEGLVFKIKEYPLSTGLILKNPSVVSGVGTSFKDGKARSFDTEGTHEVVYCSAIITVAGIPEVRRDMPAIYSRDFRSKLQTGEYMFLNKIEFNSFNYRRYRNLVNKISGGFAPERVVRTTPELEKILQDRK